MPKRPRLLSDLEVVDRIAQIADELRECRGETSECEAALRAAEWLLRAIDEKLFVYLHMRDWHTMEELRRILDDQSPR